MPSTVRSNFEQVSYNPSDLSQHSAAARVIIGDAVATRTLTAKESGALCLFDRAAGVVYTLPSPVIGMIFEFFTTVTITSNSAKFITGLATEFLLGSITIANTGAATAGGFLANGTTIRSVNGNGTTTAGVAGDRVKITAVSTTQWMVEGLETGTGVIATPFATT